MKRIRLFNTFEPTSRVYDHILPALEDAGYDVKALLSQGKYSEGRPTRIGEFIEPIFSPKPWRHVKWVNHVFYALIVPFKIMFSPRQLNIILTQPPFYYMLQVPITLLRGNPFIIHVMDLQPELFGALGKFNINGFIYRFLEKWGSWVLQKADHIIVIGRCMEDLMIKKGVKSDRISVIKIIPSVTQYIQTHNHENPFLIKYTLQNKFVVLYSGNMGFGHEFRTILQVAKELNYIKDLHFLFIGQGERRVEVETYIEQEKPENVSLLGFLPVEDLPYSIGSADVHFISLRKGVEGIMVPSKLYNCMASGKPIIFEGHPSREVYREINDQRCGVSVQHLDIEALKNAVLTYYCDPQKKKVEGINAKSAYQKYYTKDFFQKSYVACVEKVAGKPVDQ